MADETLTFGKGSGEFIAEALGFEILDTGYLYDPRTDDVAMSVGDRPVHTSELAGIVRYDGTMTPVLDRFDEVVELVKDKHRRGGGSAETCPECGARAVALRGQDGRPKAYRCPVCGGVPAEGGRDE